MLIVDSEVRGTTLQKLIVASEVRGTTLAKLIVSYLPTSLPPYLPPYLPTYLPIQKGSLIFLKLCTVVIWDK